MIFIQKVLCLVILVLPMVSSVPLKVQVLPLLQQPSQMPTFQVQQMNLQKELQALQWLQAMQRINDQQSLVYDLPQAAEFFIPPKQPVIANLYKKSDAKKDDTKITKNNGSEDIDSVIIDADTSVAQNLDEQKQRVIVLVPKQSRLGIGSIISQIPFLPFEINVIDAATWAYNGISNIISIIGSLRPPFGRPNQALLSQEDNNRGIILNALMNGKQETPMLALPVNVQLTPIQNTVPYRPMLPIQV